MTLPIAIVGGGASGTLTAYHLARRGAPVVVIDPRPALGLGLAYSTPSRLHLLNVPAGKISGLPDDPDHFLRWLRAHGDPAATAETFAPRADFGRYVQSLLADVPAVRHVRATAIACHARDHGATLTLDDGTTLAASHVVLATGNFDPAPLPGVSPAAIAAGVYRHNAWAPDTYDGLPAAAPVALIGTGLTAVDVLLRLRETGHAGTVTALSRHAVFPHRHQPHPTLTTAAIPPRTPPTCLAYLRAIRETIDGGVNWRSAVDSLRATTNDLWLALPPAEQNRFRRHLQRRWDVVRHRMAPAVADALDAERATGTLQIRHGHLAGVDLAPDGSATVRLTTGHPFAAARVINCTGPGMNYGRVNSPLLNRLLADGTATPGPLGGGLRCDDNGALIDAAGRPSAVLFNVGPGRLGTLLESIAVPELRQQAADLADRLTPTAVGPGTAVEPAFLPVTDGGTPPPEPTAAAAQDRAGEYARS